MGDGYRKFKDHVIEKHSFSFSWLGRDDFGNARKHAHVILPHFLHVHI